MIVIPLIIVYILGCVVAALYVRSDPIGWQEGAVLAFVLLWPVLIPFLALIWVGGKFEDFVRGSK